MRFGVTYNQTYNAENRLVSISIGTNGPTTQFVYDGDGNMIKQINPDGKWTIFIDGVYEEDRNSGGITDTRTYYPAGGAMRVMNGDLSYVLRDNLGSAMTTVNASGKVTQQRYYPFGAVRLTSGTGMTTDRTYTGQRNNNYIKLLDYKSRWYDPYHCQVSMSRARNCFDNAAMESFFSTLKTECACQPFPTRDQARTAIFEYIEAWYNRQRLHSSLGYLSLVEFELNSRH